MNLPIAYSHCVTPAAKVVVVAIPPDLVEPGRLKGGYVFLVLVLTGILIDEYPGRDLLNFESQRSYRGFGLSGVGSPPTFSSLLA